MKVNPFLPSYEYIPDGEPHVFGDRVYLYGSHDRFGGHTFCMNDYVCYSAPTSNLGDWRYEGVIFKRTSDPMNKSGRGKLYAPDVCRGVDGRYYLYYFVGYHGVIGVAVCDSPCGEFVFLDYVHYADGTLLGRKRGDIFQFDPGVYVEGDKTYLYTGFCPVNYPFFLTGGKPISKQGATVAVLKPDMVTIDVPPKFIARAKRNSKGTDYFGHEFFEAASMRKIKGKYYFIYSSFLGHELCYATSDAPDGEFKFGGTIVSIGDVGLGGHTNPKNASNYTGNTHGSILEIGDKYYIFYHRQTNRHQFSRQACAEEITVNADGTINQVEVTSQGLNGKPIDARGYHEARTACNLYSRKGARFYGVFRFVKGVHPYFTQSGKDRESDGDQYIANFTNGATAAFKYYDFRGITKVTVKAKGKARGKLRVVCGDSECTAEVLPSKEVREYTAAINVNDGAHAVTMNFCGSGALDIIGFSFE